MIWIIPVLLMAFGAWRFVVLSRRGLVEVWIGIFILITCTVLSATYLLGVLFHAAFS